jgi:hypothetical protein
MQLIRKRVLTFAPAQAIIFLELKRQILFSIFWEKPSQQMASGRFALFSLATILTASIVVLRLQHQLSDSASL